MDFLICHSPQTDRIDARQLSRYQLFKGSGELLRTDLHLTSIFAPVIAPACSGKTTLFDGYALVQDKLRSSLVHSGAELAKTAEYVLRNPLTHGVFAVAVVLNDGSLRANCDVLAQYPMFYCRLNDGWLISNNCHLIEQSLRMLGIYPRRSPLVLAYGLAYGSHFGSRSGVDQILILPPRSGIICCGAELNVDEWATLESVYTSSISYKDLLSEAEGELRRIANAVCEDSFEEVVCDLTGGADSRLTLAAFLANSKQDRISIYCTAKNPAPDRLVVDHLAHKYGLAGANFVYNNQTSDLPFDQIAARGIFRNFGLKLTELSDVGTLFFPSVCRVTGYFGELSRSFGGIPKPMPDRTYSAASIVSQYFARRDCKSTFLTDLGHRSVVSEVEAYVHLVLQSGVSPEHINRVTYCENRSRFHFGLSARLMHSVRASVHPLYSLPQLQAASKLGAQELLANKLGLDLTSRLAGYSFALEPRANAKWSLDLLPTELRDSYEAVHSIKLGDPPLAPPLPIITRELFQRSRAEADSPFAKKMKATGRIGRFRNIPYYQRIARRVIADMDSDDELWRYIDREQALNVVYADPMLLEDGSYGQNTRLVSANVAVLALGLLWYTGQEELTSAEQLSTLSQTNFARPTNNN